MNNSKNKLNSEMILIYNSFPNVRLISNQLQCRAFLMDNCHFQIISEMLFLMTSILLEPPKIQNSKAYITYLYNVDGCSQGYTL